MTVLKGTSGVNLDALLNQSRQLTEEYNAQAPTMNTVQNAVFAQKPLKEGDPPPIKLADLTVKLQAEAAQKKIPVDWRRFELLLRAAPKELEAAIAKFKAIDQLDMAFSKMIKNLRHLETGAEIGDFSNFEARILYHDRLEMLELIAAIRAGLIAAGNSPATANFPTAQLDRLEEQLRQDAKAIFAEVGQVVRLPPRDRGSYDAKKEGEPKANMLPPSVRLTPDDVKTVESAARAATKALGMPWLEATLLQAAREVAPGSRDNFARHLGAFAILAEEAMHAPNYLADPKHDGPDNRQSYRARKELGAMDWDKQAKQRFLSNSVVRRRGESRDRLIDALELVGRARDPAQALEQALVREFLREIGVPADVSARWNVKTSAVLDALGEEAFLPLRAINERAPVWIGKEHAAEMRDVVRTITQSVVEGRFEEWRATHATSAAQLELLNDAQRKIWLEGISVKHEVAGADGQKVVFETSEPRGFDRFWATKVGGPSHGFDTMTNCVIPLLTNARNDTIVVEDPRWPNYAGRTYLRLIQRDDTREPVLFLESSHRDFPYPGSQLETEKALVKHAIAKAKAMNIPLVLSGRCDYTIDELGLKGEWKDGKYYLQPSLINEATSVFGPHDWIQKKGESCDTSSPVNFFVDLRGNDEKIHPAA